MTFTPSKKIKTEAKEANKVRWQKKTTSGTGTLTFNNLTIGKRYRITINWIGTGKNGTAMCYLWTLSGATTYNGGGTWAGIHGNEDRVSSSTSLIFEAQSSTLNYNRQADDWGTQSTEVDAFLEELPSQEEVTEWT